jgi:hypothetical protein
MSHRRISASMLGALGIFLVFVLYGNSCGSSTSTDVSKSVSTTYYVTGYCWWDDDSDDFWDQDEDPVVNVLVSVTSNSRPTWAFQDNGYGGSPPGCWAQAYTDSAGYYSIPVDSSAVWNDPCAYITPVVIPTFGYHWSPLPVYIGTSPASFSQDFGLQPN